MLRREARITRLTFGDTDWIDVRDRIYGDNIEAQKDAAAIVAKRKPRDLRRRGNAAELSDYDMPTYLLALMKRLVVAWSDPDPIDENTLMQLPADTAQVVIDHILNTAGLDEDEAAPLEISSTSPSEQPEESSPAETQTELAGLVS